VSYSLLIRANQSINEISHRSIPELDEQLFTSDFQIDNPKDIQSLLGLSNDGNLPKTKADWIRQLNEIYCQTISLECEHIEVIIEMKMKEK